MYYFYANSSPQKIFADNILDNPIYGIKLTRARLAGPLLRPASSIFSWIFSQTRGTPKNFVGRAARKFSTFLVE